MRTVAKKKVSDLNKYMNIEYRMEIAEDKDEGGYVISIPALEGCFSSGKTVSEAIKNLKEAKLLWLKAAIEDNVFIPESDEDEFSGEFRLRMPKSLHRELSMRSKHEGISMNQYCVYLLGKNFNERVKS